MSRPSPLHLAVALDGAGWHPAAWREPLARPAELLTAGLLGRPGRRSRARPARLRDHRGLARPAVRRRLEPDRRTDQVRGRLDAVLIAARVAPLTSRHRPDPGGHGDAHRAVPHLQGDRHAGLRQQRPGRACGCRCRRARIEAALFGRRKVPRICVTGRDDPAVRSWRPGCSARRPTTSRWSGGSGTAGRTTPRSGTRPPAGSSTGDKLHYIDFVGERFSVKGPSITPRPPQGQPVVAALAHGTDSYRLVGQVGRRRLRHPARRRAGPGHRRRDPRASRRPPGARTRPCTSWPTCRVPGDDAAAAVARRGPAGRPGGLSVHERRGRVRGHAGGAGRPDAGLAGRGPVRVPAAARRDPRGPDPDHPGLVPRAAAAGRVPAVEYQASTLRGLLGLPRPANRYAA